MKKRSELAKPFALREGFWKSDAQPNLPLPKERKTTWKGQRAFIAALLEVENANNTHSQHFKGWSNCRCCQKKNGSVEYESSAFGITFKWPAGYVHYIEAHNVRPSLAFQEWILKQVGKEI